jgi:hypothetical protein
VEALKKPHVLSIYNPAFRAMQKQREHERLVSNLLRLKRNALEFVSAIRANLILAMMVPLSLNGLT